MLYINWKKPDLIRYTLYEAHSSPIKQITSLNSPNKQVIPLSEPSLTHYKFAFCCESGIVSYWGLNSEKPIKIFNFKEKINAVFIIVATRTINDAISQLTMNYDAVTREAAIIVAVRNILMRIDFYSGTNERIISEEKSRQWYAGLQLRNRYPGRMLNNFKHIDPFLQKIVETLKNKKKTMGELWKGTNQTQFPSA